MDSSTETLLNQEGQVKLNYLSINGVDPMGLNAGHKKLETVDNANDCSYNDSYDEDEGRPKLRKRNPENWKQNVRKRNKNKAYNMGTKAIYVIGPEHLLPVPYPYYVALLSILCSYFKGLEYVKANGEISERKKLGPPCTCKEKCYIKIGMDACEKIFQNFWKLGDHALQNAYIAGCVRIFLPKHCYKKNGLPSRRFFSRNFHVTVNGVDTEVCKQAFLNMHAISNGRLDRLLKKKQEIGNTGFDERGRHSNKVNKIPIEKIRLVREHINGFRKRAGFTGKRKPKKVELLPGLLNIRTMYRSYREEMILKGLEPVCEYRYRKIFHSDFHLDFGKTVVPLHTEHNHQQQQQQLESDKLINKTCHRNDNVKKAEEYPNSNIQTMQMISNMKTGDKTMPVYSQLESDAGAKDFQMRTPEVASYVIPQEVFRLDYSSYNPQQQQQQQQQQNWIFPNQSSSIN